MAHFLILDSATRAFVFIFDSLQLYKVQFHHFLPHGLLLPATLLKINNNVIYIFVLFLLHTFTFTTHSSFLLQFYIQGWEILNLIIYKMPQNKPFTAEQDQVIVYLYDELKIKQWSMVAKKMTEEYKMQRNAKQCRDRYRQALDPNSTPEWTEQEQKRLYGLHNSIGNKWALIASYFPGKTDNYVKNYFYSKLRKAMRHLNRVIKGYFKKEFKDIKIATIYKIVEGFEQQFKQKPIISQQVSNQCCQLKDALISLADEIEQMQSIQENQLWRDKVLIQKIVEFNRNYRKKSKKQKRQSLQVEELFKPAKKIGLIIPGQQAGEDSQFEGVNQVASSQSEQNQNQMRDVKQSFQGMKEQKDQLRRSPVYVIVKQDDLRDSPNSTKSKIQIRLSDLISSSKVEQEQHHIGSLGLGSSGKMLECSFGFMRGESSFTSYRSRSKTQKSRTDMFGGLEQIRISPNLKDVCTEMEAEKDQSLSRSYQ